MQRLIIFFMLAGQLTHAATGQIGTFEARHELKVTVPEGARQVRVWLAMPQDDPFQSVRDFKVDAPVPHRVTTDSHDNKTVHLEIKNPVQKEFIGWRRS